MNLRLIERPGLAAAAFLITTVLFAPFSLRGVDAHHDGLMLKPALDVAAGQTLFKDTFSLYGFLTTQIQVGFLLVFGKKLAVIKLATVLMYGIGSAFMVSAWRRILSLPMTLFAYAIWLLMAYFYSQEWIFHPWSSVYALAFQAAALYFLIQSVQGGAAGPLRRALWRGHRARVLVPLPRRDVPHQFHRGSLPRLFAGSGRALLEITQALGLSGDRPADSPRVFIDHRPARFVVSMDLPKLCLSLYGLCGNQENAPGRSGTRWPASLARPIIPVGGLLGGFLVCHRAVHEAPASGRRPAPCPPSCAGRLPAGLSGERRPGGPLLEALDLSALLGVGVFCSWCCARRWLSW